MVSPAEYRGAMGAPTSVWSRRKNIRRGNRRSPDKAWAFHSNNQEASIAAPCCCTICAYPIRHRRNAEAGAPAQGFRKRRRRPHSGKWPASCGMAQHPAKQNRMRECIASSALPASDLAVGIDRPSLTMSPSPRRLAPINEITIPISSHEC